MKRIVATGLIAITCASCTQFPEVDTAMNTRGYDTVFPTLAPTDVVIGTEQAPRLDDDSAAALIRRAAWLRQRAAQLRGQNVLSSAERARMQSAVTQHGG